MKTAFQGSIIVIQSENMKTGIWLNKLGGGDDCGTGFNGQSNTDSK